MQIKKTPQTQKLVEPLTPAGKITLDPAPRVTEQGLEPDVQAPTLLQQSAPHAVHHQPQPGSTAQLDLKSWNPHALRKAHLQDALVTFRTLSRLPPAVTFYGGARIREDDPFFALSREMGALLAKCGVPVRTGAGPGMMTSVLEGFEKQMKAGGVDPSLAFPPIKKTSWWADPRDLRTQGFRIKLPFEQEWSPFVGVGAQQELFPLRKQALRDNARGLVSLPGGYGTLDELFEGWALSGLGVHDKPMAIVGAAYFGPLLQAIEQGAVVQRPLMPRSEFNKVIVTDDPHELVDHLRTHSGGGFEQAPADRYKRIAREIDESIAVLDRLPPAVTFIGGRALDANDPTLSVAEQVAKLLTESDVPLRVGGLARVAGAVGRGARAADPDAEVQGLVVGKTTDASASAADLQNVRIHQALTDFVAHKECIGRRSRALVALPGGMGTLSELFAVLTQVQCGHLPKMPLVLVGKDFWQPIFDAIKAVMLTDARKTIAPEDLDLVTITDDPAEIARIVAEAAHEHAMPVSEAATLPQFTLFARDKPETPQVRATLAPWLNGVVGAAPQARPAARLPDSDAQAITEAHLSDAARKELAVRGIDARDAAHLLTRIARTPEEGARALSSLLVGGAGPETFRFLVEADAYCAYMGPVETAQQIQERWGDRAESVFAHLSYLTSSTSLVNPDALKVWLNGIASPGPAGDGVATMLLDACDLLDAGHKLYIEEHPEGLGDLIDVTTQTVYQHKRVSSSHLGTAMNKAILQLTGTADVPGAPPGYVCVVQLDARQNPSVAGKSDEQIVRELSEVPVPENARFDQVHITLDDHVLLLDAQRKLVAVHPT